MNVTNPSNVIRRQRVAFFFALFTFVAVVIWIGVRVYFVVVINPDADRQFVFNTLGLVPICALSWIIGFVVVGNSISRSKRLTSYGIAALILLAVPAIPVAAVTFMIYQRFLASP